MGRLGYSWAAYVKSRKRGKNMGNVYMEAAQINYRGGEKKMSVEEALKSTSGEAAAIAQLQSDVANLSDVKANQITIAPTFSAETAYDPGDLVYYNGLSYRCVNAHEGEWDADDFAATTISNELASLESGLTNVVTSQTYNKLCGKTFGNLAIISGVITGNGNSDINVGILNGYYGVLAIRHAIDANIELYWFDSGIIRGWNGTSRSYVIIA